MTDVLTTRKQGFGVEIDTAQIRSVANELEDDLSEVSAEALDAVLGSVEDGRELLVARSVDLRDALGDRAVAWGGLAKDRAADLSGELEQRAQGWREVVRSRAGELEDALPVDTDEARAYAQMGGWQVVRGLIALVAFIPRLVVRILGGLSDVVDELAGRGVDVRGRGRDLAAAIPGAGRRRSSRRRTVLLVALGAAIGFAGGIATSRRRAPIVTYDVPPRPPVDDATPIDADPLADVATPSETEAPDGDDGSS